MATEFYLGKRELISISDNEAVAYGTAEELCRRMRVIG